MKTLPEKSTSTRLLPSEWKTWGRRGGSVCADASALAAPAGVAERTWRGSLNLLVSGLERGGAPSAIRTSLTGRTCLLGARVVSEDGSLASPFANSAVSSSRGASTALGARG